MRRRIIFTLVAAGMIASTAQADSLFQQGKSLLDGLTKSAGSETGTALSVADLDRGLREALKVGTETVVAQLGAKDGFNGDDLIHIPLPSSLKTVQKTLKKFGLSDLLDDLELRLNRAAEAATPKAKALFLQAIEDMSIEDAKKIYEGPDDAATQYLKTKMSAPLTAEMRPVIDASLAEVGAIQAYDSTMAAYKDIPFVPDAKADLTSHVLDLGLAGIFDYVAKEEAAIRKDPVKQTTDILKRVFGS